MSKITRCCKHDHDLCKQTLHKYTVVNKETKQKSWVLYVNKQGNKQKIIEVIINLILLGKQERNTITYNIYGNLIRHILWNVFEILPKTDEVTCYMLLTMKFWIKS